MKFSCIVKLLSVACVLLSVVTAQTCPDTGMLCSPGNCCTSFQLCHGTTFYPLQATAPGTVCKNNQIAWASECANTPCGGGSAVQPTPPGEATTKPITLPTQAPAPTAAPVQPTYAPLATAAPATSAPVAPTSAPVAPTSAPVAPTSAPVAPTSAPVAPTAAPRPATAAPIAPTQAPGGSGSGSASPFGQLLVAYYSGVSPETVGAGGVNALAMAFFDPTPLATGTCDFSDMNTRCVQPAVNSGNKNLQWAMNTIKQTTAQLSLNTAPVRGGKPTIYFSFGGQSQGGDCWDTLLGNANTATTFGRNAALLVTTVSESLRKSGYNVYIGFDLDIEETHTALPYLSNFVQAFRAIAAYDAYPLQLCTFSGLADPSNNDFFKVGIMREMGPAQKGINFLNMMVANLDASCTEMRNYWMHPSLDFIPVTNKIFGVWGAQLAAWILHEPGCVTGSNPLFPMMKQNGVGIGIWQWWAGDSTPITSVINQVRAN